MGVNRFCSPVDLFDGIAEMERNIVFSVPGGWCHGKVFCRFAGKVFT
jgi:hypothetical protein